MVILWLDLDIIIAPANIQSSKERLALELFKDMGDLWYGVNILYRPFIDFAIVLHWSQQPILLFDNVMTRSGVT
jgi:hypothetical protein